ncbi:glutathione S-transferase family protein [Spongiibacter sp. KMU-166]|uniref:Glutathione S-transferase family protein n=1 Tax=Spongiibacter thalassae TaxID=2721624 RepID=A0ABX1GC38_9GAMM|nr:glutathione S-transferase [Spongiibacter thalassae]NKI16715.1 glutathione S-transferase family protein [Spongiibacter thalassae]
MDRPIRLRLIGAPGSPYTQKMLGLLRYRQIPYDVMWGMPEVVLEQMHVAKPNMVFMPTFLFDDDLGEVVAHCDSTPIIRELEARYPERTVLPRDPALGFIDYLLEDFADEWVTKYMFHYRWHAEVDADNAGTLLPLSAGPHLSDDEATQLKQFFTQRQISRLEYVGSNALTAPVIEASYRRFLVAMQAHLAQRPFLLGQQPAASDFAFYGQLSQLVGFDPTPRRIAHELSPRTVGWVYMMNDLSGLQPSIDGWMSLEDQSDTLRGLLAECGRVYVPALLANNAAVKAGEKHWSTEIDGCDWQQRSFPYQSKCLAWINGAYQSLTARDKNRVDRVLEGTGCEDMLKAD